MKRSRDMNKQRHPFYRQSVLVPLVAIVSVFALSAVLLRAQEPRQAAKVQQSAATKSVLGATVQADAYSLSARVMRATPPDQSVQTKRITVSATLVNTTGSDIQISPGLQMLLFDGAGRSYNFTARYLPVGKVIGGTLGTGKTWTDDIDFDIPANSIPAYLTFQLDASAAVTKVDL